jgi:N-methylhydantoinase A
MQVIGVDTGGTFTDTVVVGPGGLGVGKALTTHGRLADGVLASLAQAAASLGVSLEALLAGADVLAHGTTVGLNALLTGTGAKVGLLVTAGFESTLAMARSNKVHGLPEAELTDGLKWRKPALLAPRRRTQGVLERIDVNGAVVVPLDEDQARAAVRRLLAQGVEAIAICLLWSPVNDAHERRLAEIVAEEAPGMPVTLSSRIAPRIGEYERCATAVMNAYVAPIVVSYLDALEAALRAGGFRGLFLLMTMGGGVRQASALRDAPVHVLQSGPVGGVTACKRLGDDLGHRAVLATDVGGTSFDVGLVIDGALPRADKPRIERHALAVPVIDLASIGTGGGSIAWVDEDLGVLHVGPQSAGSMPGPACYGRGGAQPTVTDAAVVLGYLDRLGGSLSLDPAAARRAVGGLGERLGLDLHAAAEGILQVANAQMADLIRRSSIQRGHDPRDFVLYAYGGAAPQYVGRYAAEVGCKGVIAPFLAPQFSAWGAVASDLSVMLEAETPPRPLSAPPPELDLTLRRLEAEARGELVQAEAALRRQDGSVEGVTVERRIGLRYVRQIHKIDIPVGAGPLSAEALGQAERAFRQAYENLVGRGANSADTPVELVSCSVEARLPMPRLHARPGGGASTRPVAARRRPAWFDGAAVETPVFDWRGLGAGAVVAGPAFVESDQTTLVVYPGQTVTADAGLNLHLTLAAQGARPKEDADARAA